METKILCGDPFATVNIGPNGWHISWKLTSYLKRNIIERRWRVFAGVILAVVQSFSRSETKSMKILE